jgi:hypothetical protein
MNAWLSCIQMVRLLATSLMMTGLLLTGPAMASDPPAWPDACDCITLSFGAEELLGERPWRFAIGKDAVNYSLDPVEDAGAVKAPPPKGPVKSALPEE